MALLSFFRLIYPFLITTTFLAIHKIHSLSLLGVLLLHGCSVLLSFLERSKMWKCLENIYVVNYKNPAKSPNRLKWIRLKSIESNQARKIQAQPLAVTDHPPTLPRKHRSNFAWQGQAWQMTGYVTSRYASILYLWGGEVEHHWLPSASLGLLSTFTYSLQVSDEYPAALSFTSLLTICGIDLSLHCLHCSVDLETLFGPMLLNSPLTKSVSTYMVANSFDSPPSLPWKIVLLQVIIKSTIQMLLLLHLLLILAKTSYLTTDKNTGCLLDWRNTFWYGRFEEKEENRAMIIIRASRSQPDRDMEPSWWLWISSTCDVMITRLILI